MNRRFDLAIVGAGFGGSLMAMIAHQIGLSVVLVEQGSHPRMAIGESTTPLSNLLLEKLCALYKLPRVAPLAKWGTWQQAYPEVSCGLKRGFTFFHESGERLLVAASPHDAIADTHWYRAEVDHFLVVEAQKLGVEYRDHVRIESLSFEDGGALLMGTTTEERLHINADFFIDATGPRGCLHRILQLEEAPLTDMPATQSLYCHFTGVGQTDPAGEPVPYPVDDAAVHHVFEGGWVWVLRFKNGVTSAGVVATQATAKDLRLNEGASAWQSLLAAVPALRAQFRHAVPCQPFRYMPTVSFRSRTIVGHRWALLPSAAGFVDPLLSTGFALTLMGIEKLAEILSCQRYGALDVQLESYAMQTDENLLAASRLIGALYATMSNVAAFTAVSMLYFAAVSFAETAHRLQKPELASGFLLQQHPKFGPASRALLSRVPTLRTKHDFLAFEKEAMQLIEPFNIGRFGDSSGKGVYPVCAEDLLRAASKLGVNREEIAGMLEKSGFFATAQG